MFIYCVGKIEKSIFPELRLQGILGENQGHNVDFFNEFGFLLTNF